MAARSRPLFWFALGIAFTVVAALGGPFGTFGTLPLGARLAYWSGMIALSAGMATAIILGLRRALPRAGYWPRAVLASFLMAGLYGWVVVLVNRVLFDFESRLGETALIVLAISVPIAILNRALDRFRQPERPAVRAALLNRLSRELRGPVQHVRARNHQIEVRTTAGRATLLLRFADALEELAGEDGLQVHRSHWVGREVIVGGVQRGNRLFLRLKGGEEVPVSLPYRAALEAEGHRFLSAGEREPPGRPNRS